MRSLVLVALLCLFTADSARAWAPIRSARTLVAAAAAGNKLAQKVLEKKYPKAAQALENGHVKLAKIIVKVQKKRAQL